MVGSLTNSAASGSMVNLDANLASIRGDQASTPAGVAFVGTLNGAGDAISGTWTGSLGNGGTLTLRRGS